MNITNIQTVTPSKVLPQLPTNITCSEFVSKETATTFCSYILLLTSYSPSASAFRLSCLACYLSCLLADNDVPPVLDLPTQRHANCGNSDTHIHQQLSNRHQTSAVPYAILDATLHLLTVAGLCSRAFLPIVFAVLDTDASATTSLPPTSAIIECAVLHVMRMTSGTALCCCQVSQYPHDQQ